ncbi:MAG: hypothetical protein QGH40_06620, partial [bacterium]|nr:hypothetical protein [bacterium]
MKAIDKGVHASISIRLVLNPSPPPPPQTKNPWTPELLKYSTNELNFFSKNLSFSSQGLATAGIIPLNLFLIKQYIFFDKTLDFLI